MNTEQKAKAYDKAIEKARKELQTCGSTNCDAARQIFRFFPELKESEDERIKKAIVKFFELQDDNTTYSFIPKKDILAWLEKQGNHLENYDEAEKEKAEFVGDRFIKCHADFLDFKEGNTYWLEYIGDDKYNVRSDNLLGKTYHITPCQLYTVFKKLTWLEKQGEQKTYSWKPTEEQFEALDYAYNSCPDTERGNYYEGVLETLIEDLHRLEKQGETFTKKDVDDAYLKGVSDTKNEFEKQGEKPQGKSALETWKIMRFEVYQQASGNRHEPNCSDDTTKMFSLNDIDEIFERIAETCEEQGEPKFQEGDFIVDPYCRGKIIALTSDAYLLDTGQGIPFSCEDNVHRWTIKDAKDGDVLIASDESIFIYAGSTDRHAKFHLALTKCGKLNVDGGNWENKNSVHPATKEQRDLLFQKMKEASYEWDADKKELKKIKDEPENYKKQVMSEITDLVEDYIKQKPAWSEEDEKISQWIIFDIEKLFSLDKKSCIISNIEIDWLKSIKERIGG